MLLLIASRLKSLVWGSEEFNNLINKCNNRFLKHIIKSMQLVHKKILTTPESGNNRFIFQPLFRNKNQQKKWKGKLKCFLQNDFGYNRQVILSVNNYFVGTTFINCEGFLKKREISTSIDQ